MIGTELFLGLLLWWVLLCSIFIWVIYEREYAARKKSSTVSYSKCLYAEPDEGRGASEPVLPSGTPGAEASKEWTPEEWLR